MGFKEFLKTIFQSINPDAFSGLSTRSFKESSDYFLSILFISFMIMALFSIPALIKLPTSIEQEFSSFDKLNVNLDVATNKPFMFPEKDPKVVIDTTGAYPNITSEKIIITQDKVTKKASLCFWFDPLCIIFAKNQRYETAPIQEYSDLIKQKSRISEFVTTLVILALPTIMIFLYFFFMVKYIAIILLASLLAFAFSRLLLKQETQYTRLLRVATYASTVVVVLDIALIPFKINLYYVPFFIYLGLLFVGVYLLSEEKIAVEEVAELHRFREKHEKETPKGGKPAKKAKKEKTEDSDYVDLSKVK